MDEVQTGLGWTGANLCHLREGVHPDLVVPGKALAGGRVYSMDTGANSVKSIGQDIYLSIPVNRIGTSFHGVENKLCGKTRMLDRRRQGLWSVQTSKGGIQAFRLKDNNCARSHSGKLVIVAARYRKRLPYLGGEILVSSRLKDTELPNTVCYLEIRSR